MGDGELQAFLETIKTESVESARRRGQYFDSFVNPQHEIQAAAQLVEPILDRVVPGWRSADWPITTALYSRHRQAAHRAIAQLQHQGELDENLGSGAPQLDAATLHPWVWGTVQGLWSSGHYREAVGMAAKAVNAQTQAKLNRRDLSDGRLFGDAFTVTPPAAGKPRLRLTPNDGSDTFKSRHEGAASFARGLYSAIRNPIAHEVDEELDESEALEQLAAFSILARWVDCRRRRDVVKSQRSSARAARARAASWKSERW